MNGQVDQKKKPNSQDPSYWFKFHEERMMTDPRFVDAPADKKEEYLMRFFTEFANDVLDKADITKPEDIEWAKQQYIATKMKNDVAPLKPDLPTSRPEEEEAPEKKQKQPWKYPDPLAPYVSPPQEEAQIPTTDSFAGMMPEGKPEGLLANMPEIVPEGENLEKDPFVKDVGEKLLSGVARIPGSMKAGYEFFEKLTGLKYKGLEKSLDIAGINDPEKREKIMEGLKNSMAIAMGPMSFESLLRISNKLREKLDKETNYYEYWDQTEEKWAERGKRYDETITEMWKDRNIGGVAGSAMLFGAESLPQSIMAAFGGPAGLATLGTMAGGEKYQELKEMGVDEGTALLNATITGTLEGVTEMSTGALGGLIKNAYKKIGKEAAEELVKTGLRSWMTAIYKKVGIYTAPIQEGIEEYINQIGGNITDKLTGVDPDRKIGEGGFDSFMAGVGGGVYFTAMGGVAEVAKAVTPKKEVKPKEEVKPPFDFATMQVAPEIKEAARVLREEQEKFVAGLKLAPEAEKFVQEKRRIEGERYDYELEQRQKELGLPITPDIAVPDRVEWTLDRLYKGEKVTNLLLKEASDFLYNEYKRLEEMKGIETREFTIPQIESMQEFLGEEVATIQTRIDEQKAVKGFVTRPIDLADEVTVSEITETGEEPAPAEEPAKPEEEAVAEEVPPAEEPEPVSAVEEKLGPPEQAGSILAGEFAQVVSDVEAAYGERAGELEKKRDELTARIEEEFGDAVTLGRKELEQQVVDIDNQLAEIFNQEAGELTDYSAMIEQPLKDLVKRFEPDYTEDQINEVLSAAWQRMRDPKGLEADMRVAEVVSRAIDEIEGRELGETVKIAPEVIEEVAEPAAEEPPVPEYKTPQYMVREGKLSPEAESHNTMIDEVEQYNAMPRNKRKERAQLLNSILKKSRALGFKDEQKSGQPLLILGPDGKKVRRIATKLTPEEIDARPALEDYEDKGFVSFVKEMLADPMIVRGITGPFTPKEEAAGVRNVLAGKKTVASNNLLEYLYSSYQNGIFDYKETKANEAFQMTRDEIQGYLDDVKVENFVKEFGFLDPSNIDKALELGLVTEEDKQDLIRDHEEEAAARIEAEVEPGREKRRPPAYRPDIGEVEGEVKGKVPAKEEPGPVEEPPAKKEPKPKVDLKDDLNDMLGLLGDLEDPNEPTKLSQGTSTKADASGKMLQASMKLVDKVVQSGKFRFDQVLEEVIPSLPRPQLEALLPHLKSGFMGYAANAAPDVQEKMDLARTLSFDNNDLDVLIGQMFRPTDTKDTFDDLVDKHFYIPAGKKTFYIYRIEQWDDPRDAKVNMIKGSLFEGMPDEMDKLQVAIIGESIAGEPPQGVTVAGVRQAIKEGKVKEVPPYENDEYRKELEEVMDIYLSMGDPVKAEQTRKRIQVEPRDIDGNTVPWKQKAADLRKAAESDKRTYDLLAGKVMYQPIPYVAIALQEVNDAVDSTVKKGPPLSPFIREALTPAQIDRFLTAYREVQKINAQIGLTENDLRWGMTFSDYQASAPIGALAAVGIKARMLAEGDRRASEKKLKDAIKALEDSLDKSEEKIRKIKERGLEWEIKNLAWTGQILPTEDALYDLGKKWGVTDKGRIADIADLAKVKMARTINVDLTLSQLDRYSQVMAMRQTFPVYDPARIKDHEPSTDIVLSQLINEYLNASQVSNIVDPIAGNGSRVIGAPISRIRVNEQNPQKIENLKSMGVLTYQENPLKGVVGKMDIRRTPAMVISPLTVKDPTEVIKANLKDLSNDGKAVLILPGNVTQKELGKPFYSWLYKHYNVQDNIQLDGSMNNGNESHAILINGRKADPFEELPTDADFATVDEWPTLQGRILSLTLKPNEKSVLQPKVDADRGSDNLVDGGTSPGIPDKGNIRPDSTVPGEAAETPPAGEPPKEGEPTGDTAGPSPREGRERTDETDPGQPSIPIPSVGTRPAGGGGRPTFGTLRPKRDPIDLPTNNIGQPDQRTKRDLGIKERSGDEQTPYVPLSRLGSGNYVTPASIAPEVERALLQLRNHIGDVDQYVMSKLKYPSVESMTNAFYAEQVDGVAQSIFNIEGGNSMIIGHQTGTGKGRIAAATIRYAIENGKMPVFITKSADLFSDMFRDLIDISSPDYQPWMMNKAFATGRPTEIVNLNSEEKEILHRVDPEENTKIIGTDKVKGTGQLPEGTDFVMTTYSQFNDPQGSIHRRNFLMDLAQREDVVFIMDESHDASGDGSTNEFFTKWIPETQGGLFASATYAKRPDNMPIYALKTVLQEANMEWPDMLSSIQKGGTALQEIITRQLAASGQFSKLGFRFDAETNYLVLGDTDSSQRTYDPDLGTEMVEKYDKVSYSLRQIIQFQKDFIHPEVERANNIIIKYHQDNNMELGQAGAIKQHYSAQAWNILDQLLLALKVVDSVPLIVEDLKKGIKPVIALKSTMEALFADMVENGLLTKGETIDLNFSNVLKRGMRSMFRYTEKDSDGNSTVKYLEPNDLSNEAQQVLASIDEVIDLMVENKELDIPVTPIDVMRKGIEDAGFEVVEITGRKTLFELNTEMTKGKFKSKPRTNKIEALDRFNNTQGVAAIINTAGATGVSMHSSPKYQDLSQRSMYVLQNDMNINTVVQMLGRVYRANQVNKPIYNFMTTRLPAEMRMFLLNTKKLKSLDANTSGNQKQSSSIAAVKDFPDYLNKYGDKVVVEYLNENRDINLALGDPIGIDKGRVQEGGAAHKVSGKIMLLTSDQQEQFNNDILQRYNAEIEYQNTHDTNDLEVKTEELDAEIMETEIAIPGQAGVSDFGKSTVLNKANVLITDNPLNKRDIEERLAEVPDDHVEQMRKEMEQGIEEGLNETLSSIGSKYDDLRAMWKKRIVENKDIPSQDKQKQLDSKWIELNMLESGAIERAKATVRSRKKDFNELLDYFTPGQGLEIPLTVSDEMVINRTVEGVFLRFRINKNRANPWIPSNFVLEFATNDSRKVAQIASSKVAHLKEIMKNSSQLNPTQSQGILDRWDETRPREERGTRWIVTGNILQAMPSFGTGRLIEFSKKDGTTDVGIRMSDDWIKPDQRSANIPINTATEIIRKLDVEEMIEDVTGHVMIKKKNHGDPQMYDLMVPTESRFGKKYYTNERVKALMEYGKMEDNGPFHIGMFRESRLQEVLDILQEEFDVIIEASNSQAGRALGQTQHENTMEQNGVPATSKAKGRGYSPNPESFTQGSEEKRVGGRIPAAPILGKKPKPIHKIQYDLGWAVGYRTRYVRRGLGRGVGGQFQPGSGRVAIKFEKDLDTTAHEIGHAMDLHFGLLAPNAPRAELQTELSQLWQFGSDPDPKHPNPEQYRLMEGMAEFIRAWMVNPDETKSRFPKTYQWFESKVSQEPDIWNGLLQFSEDIRTWWGSEIGDQIISNIYFDTPKKASVPKVIVNSIIRRELRQGETEHGQFILTPWDNWAQKYTNMFRPLERVWKYAMAEQGIDIQDYKKLKPTQNFEIMARLFLGMNSKLNSAYRDGLIDFHDNRVYDSTRKENISFKLLMKQIPNHVWKDMDANMKEAIKLGMAERIMEVPWKLEHKQIILDLQNTNKIPPPDVWRDHSELLEEKYGHMIDAVTDRLAKGEITAEEAYHPEDSYRKFYRKRIFGIEDTIEILGRKPGEEKMNDYQKAKKYVEEFAKREAADPEAVKWIRDFNEIYRDIGEQVVKYAYESGMITEDVYNDILATNTSYMAMHRLFAATPEEMTEGRAMEGFSVAQVSTPSKSGRIDVLFKGVKGSERLTKDPVGVLMDSYQKVVEYGDRNHVIKLFANAFDQTAFGPEPELYEAGAPKMGEIAWRSSKPGENSIPYRAGGKQMYLNFADTEMFRLFNKMMFTEAKKLPKIITALPQWLRKSVVTAPVFALRNVIRDVRHFLVFGEGIQYLPGVIKDASRDALQQVFKKGTRRKEIRAAFEAHGGGQFGYMVTDKVAYAELQRQTMFEISKDPRKVIYGRKEAWKFFQRGVQTGLSGFEKATRMIQFRASIKKAQREYGLSEAEAMTRAAYQARDLMDFMVGGEITKQVNQAVIFLNPAIRGWEKIFRSLKYKKTRNKVLMRMLFWQVGGGILNSAWVAMRGSDDDKEEYLNAPAYQRDMYDRYPIGGGSWIFIPRPFELAAITSLAQRATDKILFNDPNAFNKEFMKSLGHIMLPTDMPGIFSGYSGAINAIGNYDFFRQKYIIPPADVNTPIAGRNYDYASKFSKLLMKGSDLYTPEKDHYKLDPRHVDAFISGQFSYYGNFFLKMTEAILPGEAQDKFKLNVGSTGFVRQAFHYSEPDVQWVIRAARDNKELQTSPDYENLRNQISKYFEKETMENMDRRREVGAQMRKDAQRIRKDWEPDMELTYTRQRQKKEMRGQTPSL